VHYTAYPGYGAVYGGINALGFSQQAGPQQAMGHVLLTYPSGGVNSYVNVSSWLI